VATQEIRVGSAQEGEEDRHSRIGIIQPTKSGFFRSIDTLERPSSSKTTSVLDWKRKKMFFFALISALKLPCPLLIVIRDEPHFSLYAL